MASASIKQGNWFVAEKCLRRIPKSSFDFQQYYLMLKLNFLKSNFEFSMKEKMESGIERLMTIIDSLQQWIKEEPHLLSKPRNEVFQFLFYFYFILF